MINFILEFYNRSKYFLYFNLFLNVLILNLLNYKITLKVNEKLIKWLHYTINLNGCILIKMVQWINSNVELLDIANSETIYNIFSSFYENCDIHSLNYTKTTFFNDFHIDFDEIIELDTLHEIKSGSIAQVYKAKYKNQTVALKVVHPDIDYQLIFPIMFIKLYKYIVKNISCLTCYDTLFAFDSFFDNLIEQSNMVNELDNMKLFYDTYKENDHIIIPKPIISSENILIMEYVDGSKFELSELPVYEKQKIVQLLTLFIKDNYYFKNFYHSDLHESNWKIIKYNDFYKLVIYDYGYISKNNDHLKNTFKNISYYNDTLNIDGIVGVIYEHCDTKLSHLELLVKFKEYLQKLQIELKEPFCDELILKLYTFLIINKIKVGPSVFELFISMILFKKNILKFLNMPKIGIYNTNILVSTYLASINICDKYGIFSELRHYYQLTYIDNPEIKKMYKFQNNYFEDLKTDNSLDI
tara:strand:- start:2613 stop:4022 length:1410 start_codon:yes stop_codon:yes gene_type:complete